MIGVDTNLLVRLFVTEDADQHASATAFFSERDVRDPAYINLVVLVEFVWVLSRRYGYSPEDVRNALMAIIANAGFAVEQEALVIDVIEQAGRNEAGIADLLIAGLNAHAGCPMTTTFDKTAAKHIPGMELLA